MDDYPVNDLLFDYQDLIADSVMAADQNDTVIDIYNRIAKDVPGYTLDSVVAILHLITINMEARKKWGVEKK